MIANLLTILRLALLGPFLAACAAATAGGARASVTPLLLFSVAAATDLLDGWAARHGGTASDRGRALDHATDMVFVMTSMVFFAAAGRLPWWVPGATGAAVAVYAPDLRWASHACGEIGRARSALGHAAGVFNYALVGMIAADVSFPSLLPALLMGLTPGVVATVNIASAIERTARRGRRELAVVVKSFYQPRRA